MGIRGAKRQRDEEILLWIKARAKGISPRKIGEIYGASQENIATATNKVMNADLKEAAFWGDKPKDIIKAYW
jgi:hypothetical protein